MTERKYRHPDGVGRKRFASTHEPMTPDDLMTWLLMTIPGDGYDVQVSPGVYLTWYSPLTVDEAEKEAIAVARQKEATDKWERETYEGLREKFEANAVTH